jgi:hypothetical protein
MAKPLVCRHPLPDVHCSRFCNFELQLQYQRSFVEWSTCTHCRQLSRTPWLASQGSSHRNISLTRSDEPPIVVNTRDLGLVADVLGDRGRITHSKSDHRPPESSASQNVFVMFQSSNLQREPNKGQSKHSVRIGGKILSSRSLVRNV